MWVGRRRSCLDAMVPAEAGARNGHGNIDDVGHDAMPRCTHFVVNQL